MLRIFLSKNNNINILTTNKRYLSYNNNPKTTLIWTQSTKRH